MFTLATFAFTLFIRSKVAELKESVFWERSVPPRIEELEHHCKAAINVRPELEKRSGAQEEFKHHMLEAGKILESLIPKFEGSDKRTLSHASKRVNSTIWEFRLLGLSRSRKITKDTAYDCWLEVNGSISIIRRKFHDRKEEPKS